MREKLADYDHDRLALQSLVYDLEALIASLLKRRPIPTGSKS